MANWRSTRPAPSQLAEGRELYAITLGVARNLDAADLDLWAGGVRCCLDAPNQLARQQHLIVELTRLKDFHLVRKAGCADDIREALDRLMLGLGSIDVPHQPLYTAARDLADHLELSGGRKWLNRLRVVTYDRERTAAARLERLKAVLERMQPGAEDLPIGSTPLVRGVLGRLGRVGQADDVMTYLEFAFRPAVTGPTADDQSGDSSPGHALSDGPATVRLLPTTADTPSS